MGFKNFIPQTLFHTKTLSRKHLFIQSLFHAKLLSRKHFFMQKPYPANTYFRDHMYWAYRFPIRACLLNDQYVSTLISSQCMLTCGSLACLSSTVITIAYMA